ncbi:MAG TPA: methylmalonyl-CoA mutase family protein, partial [Gemmatimonadaceae bacterium]|nr:methylmalonyl-CoA mutase family protein [Gemmatimonadaceae bacterium]
LEERATALIAQVDDLGGSEQAIAAGFFQDEIARSAYEFQLRVEAGDTVIVGVNKFADGNEPPVIPTPDFSALERTQVSQLTQVRQKRDPVQLRDALTALANAAQQVVAPQSSPTTASPAPVHLMPHIISAVRARASVGEISDTLAAKWGIHHPSI